ncbi:MAG TPA: hypothetical protein VFG49_01635 [Dyella sp.]|uniref:hypothetical protein n=1 Tax=Dyella sp. TaxID=1869338 RepID=UPI002D76CBA1|nr:hypothetical protein [Dyella sp.]HET6552213.1 hypothetical protein [Dyella sp.]
MSTVRFLGPYDKRVAAELPEGYVVGSCPGDCVLKDGVEISGVVRGVGEQHWSDGSRTITVWVEDFDLDVAGLRNWSTGVE